MFFKRRRVEKVKNAIVEAFQSAAARATYNDPTEDPKHEAYEEECCDDPDFRTRETEPVGMIRLYGGRIMEVWRCANCGKVPNYPNAPFGVEMFSSDDEGDKDDDDEYGGYRNIEVVTVSFSKWGNEHETRALFNACGKAGVMMTVLVK